MINLSDIVDEIIEKSEPMKLVKDVWISDRLKYHLDNKLTLEENIFRIYSEGYFKLVNEVRHLYSSDAIELNDDDLDIIESDLGFKVLYEGREIFLDAPIELEEDEYLNEVKHRGRTVHLSRPFRTPGGPKKFAVYVRSKAGKIKKVTFGDPNMRIRVSSKSRRKSFRARHKCDQKKDRTTAGYWSCRNW
jgi:hypothetical protein